MGTPSRFGQIQADAFLGSANDNSAFGKIWYVDGTNGADGNSGLAPDEAYSTIGQAITSAVATRGDTVVIYPGTYTVTSALAPKAQMTFRAAIVVPQAPSVTIGGAITNLVTVDVSGVRFIGVEFKATAGVYDLVKLADTSAITGGVLFEDCVFNGNDTTAVGAFQNGVCGIWAADGTNAVTGLVVRRCTFRDLGKTQIEIGVKGMPYAKIEDNTFSIDTPSGIGIFLDDTGAVGTGKGYAIRQNEFLGNNGTTSTTVGIVIRAATIYTTAIGIIRDNFFSYCATAPITAQKVDGIINNFGGAASGTKVSDL